MSSLFSFTDTSEISTGERQVTAVSVYYTNYYVSHKNLKRQNIWRTKSISNLLANYSYGYYDAESSISQDENPVR